MTDAETIEQMRVQLAGCGVAALGGTSPDQVANKGQFGWSPAYQDVLDLRRRHDALMKEQAEIDQILGKALGYPRYCDSPEIFHGATEADGVCTGEHTAVTLAMEAASRIKELSGELVVQQAIIISERACAEHKDGIIGVLKLKEVKNKLAEYEDTVQVLKHMAQAGINFAEFKDQARPFQEMLDIIGDK